LKVFISFNASGYAPFILRMMVAIITPCIVRDIGYRASRIPYFTNLLRKTASKSWRSSLHSYSL